MGMPLKTGFLIAFMLLVTCVFTEAKTIQSYYDLGVFAYESGDYEMAEDYLKLAVDENFKDAYAKYYLGKTLLKLNKLSEAEIAFKRAKTFDPNIPGLNYDMGILYYKIGSYQKASDLFEKAMAEDPLNALAVYYAGISSFMMGDYRKAQDYLLKSSELSPSVKSNAYYYAGICSYKLGNYDKAIDKLDFVAANAGKASLREDASMWLQVIKAEKKQAKPYDLYAKIGFQYDDNVTLAPVNSDIISDKSDEAAVGYFTGRYKFIKRQQYDIGVGYSHYQTKYEDLSEYDLIGAIPEIFAEYRFDPVTLGLAYIPSYYWVDSDSYLMQHQFNPQIRWQIDENNEADLSYSYYRNKYFSESERDGHTNEFDLDLYHGLTNLKGYLFCSGGYEDTTASSKDEYYTQASATFGISYNLFESTNFVVYGAYYDKQYDYTDSTYNVKRDDSRYFASATVTQRIFYDWLHISAEYTYTKNNSNISDYEYKRNTITLYIVANM